MAVNVYKSTDIGAPYLIRDAGELIKVLDACLVNGYGSKPSAGWTKEFSGTNIAVYRPPAGHRCYLRVDDNQTCYSKVQAYATMSDINTGTEPFSDYTSGYTSAWFKTNQSDTSGAWEIFATDRSFYFISPGLPVSSYPTNHWTYRDMFFFGDYVCLSDDFPYNTALFVTNRGDNPCSIEYWTHGSTFGSSGKYCRRGWNHLALPTAIAMETIHGDGSVIGNHNIFSYPDKLTGTCHIDKIRLRQENTFMGYMPGLYDILHPTITNYPFEFEGAGALSGKIFRHVKIYGGSLCFQIIGDWYEPVF